MHLRLFNATYNRSIMGKDGFISRALIVFKNRYFKIKKWSCLSP